MQKDNSQSFGHQVNHQKSPINPSRISENITTSPSARDIRPEDYIHKSSILAAISRSKYF